MPQTEERQVMSADDIRRVLSRIAHEILEHNKGAHSLVFVGIHTRGVPLARRLANLVRELEGIEVPTTALDISLYRDDVLTHAAPIVRPTELNISIEGKSVVLVDDVLYTGRSVRAALDAITDFGRPLSVQLAVLVDRGHRELPIRADYVGKNIPTARREDVQVRLREVDGKDEVTLIRGDV
jgi:pyrimidine operon attenuation protein/uracil phosphoribosyltransferase